MPSYNNPPDNISMAETENKTPSRPPQPLSRHKKQSSGNILKATQQDDEYR